MDMIFYCLFYFFQIYVILFLRNYGYKDNKYILLAAIIFSTLFAGLRGDVGVDTFAYREFYNAIDQPDREIFFEPTFTVIALIGNLFGFGSQFLILSVALMQGFFLYLIIRKIKEKDIFYLLFLSTFYVYINLNLIRVGLAMCILGFAMLVAETTKGYKALLAFSTAVVTHFTTVIMA